MSSTTVVSGSERISQPAENKCDGEAGGNDNIEDECDENVPYSAFSPRQRLLIAYSASISATFSGLSSFIYYPAITALATSLRTSTEAINLTVTAYLVTSGLAPSVLGDLADRLGRRPITLLALTLYLAANIGLALQNEYSLLVVLRCLQSAGSSGTIALAYGVISDISTPANRGSYVAILMGFTNAAPSLGPVLGGILTEELSWHWIFWLLGILGGVHLLAVLLFLPETSRAIVGNGGLAVSQAWQRPLYSLVFSTRKYNLKEKGIRLKCALPNPFSCLTALFNRINFVTVFAGGLQYTIFGCLAASLSTQVIHIYSLKYLAAGLVYLPSGAGGVVAAYSMGKILNRDYRLIAQKYGLSESKPTNDMAQFPIEEARLHSIFPLIILSCVATIGYGWSLQAHAKLAVPLILQFFTGSCSVAMFSVYSSLLTDLNPDRSATVQASYNLVRCALGAAGVAVLQEMIEGVGVGWCFTIFGIVGASVVPLLLLLKHRGPRWRGSRFLDVARPGPAILKVPA